MKHPHGVMREGDGVRMAGRVRETYRLARVLRSLGESAELGEAVDQPGAVVDRYGRDVPEELVDPVGGQGREVTGGKLDDALVVASPVMRLLQIVRGDEPESQVPEAAGDLQRTRADRERLAGRHGRLLARQEGVDQAVAVVVVQALGERLGFEHALEPPPSFRELAQHRAQLEADVEGLLEGGSALRQSLESVERLLERGPRFRERGPGGRLESDLPEIVNGLVAQVALDGGMGKSLDLLAETIPVERLDRADDPSVKLAAAIVQQSPVRDLVRERVLEGVLEIGIEPGLVE